MQFFPAPSYSLLGQNIFLSKLFSKIFSLSTSDNVRDQGPHPCKTTGIILLPLILIFIILDCVRIGKSTETNGSRYFLKLIALNFFMHEISVR